MAQPARRMHNTNQQDDGADKHHQTLHGVVQHAGAKAAESGVQRNTDTKDEQAGFIGDPCGGFQQTRAANKLDGHCADKGNQQAQARQPDHQATLVAGKQHIVERHGVIATSKDSELFAQYPQRQPDGR